MEAKPPARADQLRQRLFAALRARLSIRGDQATYVLIDENLRSGAELQGATIWILMLAIFIASIGLNVNSTAVIIGAMLISPLMGPIMGIGYGVGIYDFQLIRQSLKSLGIATLISLLTSTVYFLITPLTTAQSELIARTTPTLWDVLIALFGGLAGIIGATRREKSNVIPGVAIATALMPPLCTTGYALARGHLQMLLGAFYLFAINAVFIAFATVIVIWLLHPPHKKFVDEQTEARVRRYLIAIVLATVVPSVFLAVRLVQDELFNASARQFIQRELSLDATRVIEQSIEPKRRRIEVTLVGERLDKAQLARIQSELPQEGLANTTLIVHQSEDNRIDVSTLKASIASDLFVSSQKALAERDKTIARLQQQLQAAGAHDQAWRDVGAELHAVFPQVTQALLADATAWSVQGGTAAQKTVVLAIKTRRRITRQDRARIAQWLKIRTHAERVEVIAY